MYQLIAKDILDGGTVQRQDGGSTAVGGICAGSQPDRYIAMGDNSYVEWVPSFWPA
jgi:hypothetical protein